MKYKLKNGFVLREKYQLGEFLLERGRNKKVFTCTFNEMLNKGYKNCKITVLRRGVFYPPFELGQPSPSTNPKWNLNGGIMWK